MEVGTLVFIIVICFISFLLQLAVVMIIHRSRMVAIDERYKKLSKSYKEELK